jgi:hypothetical protein
MRSRRRLVAWSDRGAATGRVYAKRRRRPPVRQSQAEDSPARNGTYAASLREEPEPAVHVQGGARHPHQQRVGISEEARRHLHPES